MKNGKQRLMDLVTVIDRINGNIGRVLATFVLVMAGIMLHKEHISMDLFYDRWTPRAKAMMDSITFVLLAVQGLAHFIRNIWFAVYGEELK